MIGYLQFNDWAGRRQQAVEIVCETSKKIRIKAITNTRLAGKGRWLMAGGETTVPKYAVSPKQLQNVEVVK